MYSINMSNVPGVLPGVQLQRCVRYSCSVSLTSVLHLTVHAGPLELGPKFPRSNSFSLDPSKSVKVKLFDRGTRS